MSEIMDRVLVAHHRFTSAHHGVAPSILDLCEALGLKSKTWVWNALEAAQEQGYVLDALADAIDSRKSRGLVLTPAGRRRAEMIIAAMNAGDPALPLDEVALGRRGTA